MDKLGYCYDGSSDWSIGPSDDPQANPICHVWNRNDEKAKATCELICNSINQHASLLAEREELVKILKLAMADYGYNDNHWQEKAEKFIKKASPQRKEK